MNGNEYRVELAIQAIYRMKREKNSFILIGIDIPCFISYPTNDYMNIIKRVTVNDIIQYIQSDLSTNEIKLMKRNNILEYLEERNNDE